jgi:hypothetical protein
MLRLPVPTSRSDLNGGFVRDLPLRARLFVLAIVVVSLTAVTLAALGAPIEWADVVWLGVAFGITSVFSVQMAPGLTHSVAYIVSLAAVSVLGWHAAGIVGLFGFLTTVHDARFSARLTKRVFNMSQFALAGLLAGLAFSAISPAMKDTTSTARVILAALTASIVYSAVNIAVTTRVVSLVGRVPWRRVVDASVAPTVVIQLGYALLGVLFAQIYVDFGPVSAVFVLAPLLIARQAFANYAELRSAYESTLRALVQAVETKDLYTRGHSERVGKAAQLIARQRGLREDRVQIVHYAGMLHDVGKLGVPTRVLQKQGKLNDEEFGAIKLHPLRGYEMLAEIDFLTEALSGVYHHHERMDGRGYPMGLTEEEIPEIARIIMVADAFDSMTSTRSYRRAKTVDEAVQELRRCEGSQFDPEVVNSLVAAVEKHGWQTAPETYFGETVSREGVPIPHNDHFDPDPDLTDLRLLMGETGDGVS